ncbi:MAG: OprO/OprP family phosphate-selective porin [Gammaproteobacteria bacterium]|nr:OprO/OprP family phosphate-selective porin [Gammaproteobacteria bacterium]MDH5727577.1 OprO/OprP family phosphate-selective porin [Gammaproteobacteria bacterium]
MKKISRFALAAACAGSVLTFTVPMKDADAANWLMLQGTERSSAVGRAKVWGFVQGQMQYDFSDPHTNGKYIPPKLIGPNLTSQKQFNVNRARIGVRGTGFPLDSKVNYFLLAEFGNNGITAADGGAAKMTDASVTFNHIPFARVRAGLFKTPGAEEGLQAIHVFDYVNFTNVTNQMLLERFVVKDRFGAPLNPQNPDLTGIAPNGLERGVAAFRDVGVQVFDTISFGKLELTYAGMVGNGNGLNVGDYGDQKDVYGYLSAEQVFGGKGGRREGAKVFAWMQQGKRLVDMDAAEGAVRNEYVDRKRMGAGAKYLKKPFRVTAEYMAGEGMIFVGAHKQNFDMDGITNADGSGLDGKANGFYADFGFYIPGTKAEIDLRYDVYNRLVDDAKFEVKYTTTTIGAQYHLNKKSRVAANYEIRKIESVNDNAGLVANFEGVGPRASVQFTAIY